MGERVESMNAKPVMFQAGICSKFTKRHVANFHGTTLTAASMAKQRAEKKIEKQADAIEKQQKKIETEMKKIEEITQKLHRQQVREAKRLRNRLHFATVRIQRAFRRNQARWKATQVDAVTKIQCRWRGVIARIMARERVLLERCYAATMIPSIVRMVIAKNSYRNLQRKRDEERRRHQTATLVQCNVRICMTRLIYLDVLYVICRIQAVIRGFLIRRRLQWVAAIDVDGICKFQALARGYIVRQRLREMWRLHTERSLSPGTEAEDDGSPLSEDASSPQLPLNSVEHDSQSELGLTTRPSQKIKVKASESKLAARFHPQVEIMKQSYWLPAGASLSKRLPVLPSKRVIVDRDSDDMSGDVLGLDVSSRAFRARTPKKRNQKNRPARLTPVSASGSASARLASDAETELRLENHAAEEKLKREEELKQKLLSRETQEKKKLEQEQKLKREQEVGETFAYFV